MPDPNSAAFWKDVATAYKNHPAVIFDLYNEPHDVSWDIWLRGGKVAEKGRGRRSRVHAVPSRRNADAAGYGTRYRARRMS